MKTLIVAEKPSVAVHIASKGRKILGDFYFNGTLLTKEYAEKNEAVLKSAVKKAGKLENDKYIISFAEGHLVTLFDAKDYDPAYANWRAIPFPYVPDPFKLKINPRQEFLYKNLVRLMELKDVNEIICATDADREGSNIWQLIAMMSGNKKPVKRLWVDSHNEEYLEKAFKQLKDNKEYKDLEDAGYCRMTSDWLLGAALTAKTTIKIGQPKEVVNVGRVQTAVLNEIVRVDDLITNFSKKKFYQAVAKFKTDDGIIYEGTYDEKFEDPAKAESFIKSLKNNGMIVEYTEKNENQYSQPLYDQTSLQIEMSNTHNIPPAQTLEACQFLYEKGYATYPRTASRYITKGDADSFANMYKVINQINPLAANAKFNKNNIRIVNDSKVDSHGAIIPTTTLPDLTKLTETQRKVYEEIVKRVIAVNYDPAVDLKQNVETDVSGFIFKSSGKKELKRGWREVYDTQVKDTSLPTLKKDSLVNVLSIDKKEIESKPPKRYTEATILGFMETCGKKFENEELRDLMKEKGIGTVATRAEIISGLSRNGYIELKKKVLYPTEKGISLIKNFPVDELKSAEFTGEMEYKLHQVEKGQMSKDEFNKILIDLYKISCSKLDGNNLNKIGSAKDSVGKCPLCGSDIVKRKGKFGEFYGCNGWKTGCKFSINKICGKLLTEKQVQALLEKGRTGKIKGLKKKDGTELSPAAVKFKKFPPAGKTTDNFEADYTIELDFSK